MKLGSMARDDDETVEGLAIEAKQGDRRAFSKIVRMTMASIYSLAYRMTGDRDAAEDLVQETFVSAWEKLGSFKAEGKFANWLYQIASNRSLNYLRTASRYRSLSAAEASTRSLPAGDTPDRRLEQEQLRRGVLDFMAQLPDQQRLAFELRFYRGMPFGEIARIMGRAEGTVKTHYREAVIKLREHAKARGWKS